jgi:acetyl esterase/lipase
MSISEMREAFDQMLSKVPVLEEAKFSSVAVNGVHCEKIHWEEKKERLIIFIHGGGYVIGTPKGYRSLAARIGRACNSDVLVPDYRLAPEFPFPNGLGDVVGVYAHIIKNAENRAVFLVGDSAGAGLIVSTLMRCREEGIEMPKGAVLLCPWLDLTLSGESYRKLKRRDPMLTEGSMRYFAKNYIGKEDPRHPYASPIFGDYTGFPPMLVQAGEHDILRSDAEHFSKKAEEQKVATQLHVWKGMFHVWQFYARILPEAEQAIEDVGDFVNNVS